MFLLQELPNEEVFKRFIKLYPELDPPSVAAFLRLLKTGSNLLCWLDSFLSDYEISHGKWIILILLKRSSEPSLSPSELAKMQGVKRPTTTKLLQSLKDEGLVKIASSKEDSRGRAVTITRKGEQKLDQIMPTYYSKVTQIFSEFEKSELKSVICFLDKINGLMEEKEKLQ